MNPTPFEADCNRKASGLRDFNDHKLRRNVCANCLVLRKFHREVRCRYRRMTDAEWADYCGIPQEPKGDKDNYLREVVETKEGGLKGLYYFRLECGHRETRLLSGVSPKLPTTFKCAECAKEDKGEVMGWLNGKAKEDQAGATVLAATPVPEPKDALVLPDTRNSSTPVKVNPFAKAVKYDARGRVALIGPAGSGKSYTALLLARLLAGPQGKIAAIDTEHGSLSKYADLFDFDVLELDSYSPQTFLGALHAAEEAGYDVFVCDSMSHFWTGKDGAFDFVDTAQKRQRDQQAGWKEFRPYERQMMDDLLASPMHAICTLQTANAYETQMIDGKQKRTKVGLKPVQRDGMEYFFDLVGYMTDENTFVTDKTRCPDYAQKAFAKPGTKEFEPFVKWLKGAPRDRFTAPAQIDTGHHLVGTVAAAQYVAEQKLASGKVNEPAALKAPWKSITEAGQFFAAVRERVGEVIWREHLDAQGWRELVEMLNAMGSKEEKRRDEARQKARELYWTLDAIARKEGK